MNGHDGIVALGLSLPPGAEEKLAAYLALLAKWNRIYNLTAIRDTERMVTHHLLDCLSVLPYLADLTSLADVGSGGGLPGLVMAICRPDLRVISIEPNQKKAAFQQQVRIELDLKNVDVHCSRVETADVICDAAISRAFAELADFVALAGHLAPRLFAMKGVRPAAEIARLSQTQRTWRVVAEPALKIPGLNAERHLLILEKT
jgi:16S rRNA (guanine527-N7)-methyltransferase